jgi:hypothetical protein
VLAIELQVVSPVTCHHGPAFDLGEREDLTVGQRSQIGSLRHGHDVTAPIAELSCDRQRDHLIQKCFHPSSE